ncbi:MAG: twin transmembrane helix small protein [Rubrimonas sp.]|uniref:twin transmembrane helix small protein n=1 Tax=Rubrimonas sp. TaxID=2036015 RepID=UPI002FDDA334
MSSALTYVTVVACLAVLAVLLLGFMSFAKGGEFNRRWSNKLMRLRVALQAAAVVLIVVLAWALRNGG